MTTTSLPALLVSLLLCFSSAFVQYRFASPRMRLRLFASDDIEKAFPNAEILELTLIDHKPLGCTVEESLGDSELKPVFVSKVIEGGHAAEAGIRVGDVIVGVTGIFGGMENVLGKGIEAVTTSVSGRAIEEALEFRIARGTSVLSEHESALVDLCATVGVNDQEIEDCVMAFLESTYGEDDEAEDEVTEDDTDELLENMFENLWGREVEESLPIITEEKQQVEVPKPKSTKPMPWRSRSSGSGTFVRDPKTGQMKNIDVQ